MRNNLTEILTKIYGFTNRLKFFLAFDDVENSFKVLNEISEYLVSIDVIEEDNKPSALASVGQAMYAKCLNTDNTYLTRGKEYRVVAVKSVEGFGDKCFYLLEDGLLYSSTHFSVTYLKQAVRCPICGVVLPNRDDATHLRILGSTPE